MPDREQVSEQVLSVEPLWCPGCAAECAAEIVALPDDPSPVAICLGCCGGVETAWQPVAPADAAARSVDPTPAARAS